MWTLGTGDRATQPKRAAERLSARERRSGALPRPGPSLCERTDEYRAEHEEPGAVRQTGEAGLERGVAEHRLERDHQRKAIERDP
ncbi:hypothetical protein [Streptomyces iconiensis]|uniref:Uncharacterized protein n=1 Tax=Streptomyces iconiensis TaxID=1384038 RepID=A0ABT6ZVT2_9ACTN|nr:hypothetical protein [Streptomyces iconiensis]MDJ1133177.1 hypothetical protein [Streptomyces iconiensis]